MKDYLIRFAKIAVVAAGLAASAMVERFIQTGEF